MPLLKLQVLVKNCRYFFNLQINHAIMLQFRHSFVCSTEPCDKGIVQKKKKETNQKKDREKKEEFFCQQYLVNFILFRSFRYTSFRFVLFRFVSFCSVPFRFVLLRFVSVRFRFLLYRDPTWIKVGDLAGHSILSITAVCWYLLVTRALFGQALSSSKMKSRAIAPAYRRRCTSEISLMYRAAVNVAF